MAVLSPGVGGVLVSHINELTKQLERTRAEVVSLTAKLFDLEEARDKAVQVHEGYLKKAWTEARTLKEHTVAEWEGALSHYYSKL